jgi:hypothetical protein
MSTNKFVLLQNNEYVRHVKDGTVKTVRPDTVILHSRSDDVIPFADRCGLRRKTSQSGIIGRETDTVRVILA